MDRGHYRPDMFSIGIGLGYVFPTSLETPNITTVRFRLISGLTFEPTVFLQGRKQTVDTGMAVDTSQTTVGLAALVRYPLVAHGRVDLELLGAAALDNVKDNPPGSDDETSTTTTSLAYGLAVSTWINPHWQVSLSSTNTLLQFAKVRQENGPGAVTVNSDTTFGAVFDPTVFVMVHAYH
jgi:hypothetical protein